MKKILIIISALLVMLIIAFFGIFERKDENVAQIQKEVNPEELISHEDARKIVLNILEKDEEKDGIEAFLYPEIIAPGTVVGSWDEDVEDTKAEKYYWFAWIDRDPGNVFFAHETEFVFIDAVTKEYIIKQQEFWPVIDDKSFEGDNETRIRPTITEEAETISINLPEFNIRDIFAKEVIAHPEGRYMHITPSEPGFEHEDYAVIISGFGRNSWVFLDGIHDMYDALKAQGYDDDHIYFLAQGPVKLDPTWDRKGNVKLQRLEKGTIDMVTNPENVEKVFTELKGKMTERDSLFVFVLAHGNKGKISMGQPLSSNQLKNASIGQALKGKRAKMKSDKFASVSVGSLKACEVMIIFDSCYSGSHKAPLQAAWDTERIKRLEVAHSTDGKTKSYGADYVYPPWYRVPYKNLDKKARRTKIADPNPTDHGGEFSSGFIDNMSGGIFSLAYNAGVGLDSAELNKMTKPSMWRLGEEGPCVIPPSLIDPPSPPPLTDPQDEELDEPEEPTTPPKETKTIQAIPHSGSYISLDQVQKYTPADCPACADDHWHAIGGTAKTINNQIVVDPYANCGLGKVSEHPVTEVEIEVQK